STAGWRAASRASSPWSTRPRTSSHAPPPTVASRTRPSASTAADDWSIGTRGERRGDLHSRTVRPAFSAPLFRGENGASVYPASQEEARATCDTSMYGFRAWRGIRLAHAARGRRAVGEGLVRAVCRCGRRRSRGALSLQGMVELRRRAAGTNLGMLWRRGSESCARAAAACTEQGGAGRIPDVVLFLPPIAPVARVSRAGREGEGDQEQDS